MFSNKNLTVFYSVLFIFSFLFVSVLFTDNASAAKDTVIIKTAKNNTGFQAWITVNGNKITLPPDLEKVIGISAPGSAILLPSGKILLTNNGRDLESSHLYVYDPKKTLAFDITPFMEIDSSDDTEMTYYGDFNPSPDKKYLQIFVFKMVGIDISRTVIVVNLKKLDEYINTIITDSTSKTITQLKDGALKAGAIMEAEGYPSYDFQWKENGHYTYRHFGMAHSDPIWGYYKPWENKEDYEKAPQTIYEADAETGKIVSENAYPSIPFPDLKPDDPDYALILKWQQEGWIKGDSDGKINLDKIMTRKDMMKYSYLINIPAIPADAVWPCSDLDIKDPLAPLFFQGFKDGLQLIGRNKCAPEEPVTRLEVISMIFSGFEYEPAKIDCQDRWPDYYDPMLPNAPYAALAKSNNLFGKDAKKLEPNKSMTKREAIKLDQLVVDETIGGYNNPSVIPCDIDKYAKEYIWNPDSAVSKLLFRRKLMKWGIISIVSVLGLGGIVYGIVRLSGKRKK